MSEVTDKATARPWKMVNGEIWSAKRRIAGLLLSPSPQSAIDEAFIFQAVNSFDALVAALRAIQPLGEAYLAGSPWAGEFDAIDAALKLAEGKESEEDYRSTRGLIERGHKDIGCPIHFYDTCAEKR